MASGSKEGDIDFLINLSINDPDLSEVVEHVSDFIDEIAYKGFDPRAILKELLNRATEAGYDHQKLKSDCFKLIVVFFEKGNNMDKIIRKSGDRGAALLNNLKTVYRIANNAQDSTASTVTLSRIAASFPIHTVSALEQIANDKLKRPVSLDEMRVISPDFPKICMCSVTASVICNESPNAGDIITAIGLYCTLETKKIKKDMKNKDFRHVAAVVNKYLNISYTSDFVPTSTRKTLMAAEKIMATIYDSKGNATPAVLAAAKKFKELHEANKWPVGF